jgi:hypothetical protein
MPTGHYRFRRSLGNVSSNFRGARPDTYPLLSYVLQNRALDLSNVGSLTISDISGNGNNATLYTGIYVSTNGTTDKAIVADASAAGIGNYYLTGKIKPSGTTQAKATIDGSALNLSGLTADVWQDFTTTTKTSVTPDTVSVGWNGGGNYSAADWSDVRLIDASDDSVVAHWKLYDSAAASLGGYPAIDCVGGYHGAHVGCAGGSGEASILQTAGEDFNKRMWFDGVNDYVRASVPFVWNNAWDVSFKLYAFNAGNTRLFTDSTADQYSIFSVGGTSISVACGGFGSGINLVNWAVGVIGSNMLVRVKHNGSGLFELFLDGASQGTRTASTITPKTSTQLQFSGRLTSSEMVKGLMYGVEIDIGDTGTNDHEYLGNGNTDAAWTDQVGSANGTVNGSPSLYHVAESETTAGQDALGNAIVNPRPNSRVLNLTTGTGYATVADSDSLDLTTAATWELWGNFYGSIAGRIVLLSKYDTAGNQRSWWISKEPSGAADGIQLRTTSNGIAQNSIDLTGLVDTVSQVVITKSGTTHKLYVNSSLVDTIVGGDASMYVSTAPLLVSSFLNAGVPSSFSEYQEGDIRIYNSALTADEVLQNYNARKSAYGL